MIGSLNPAIIFHRMVQGSVRSYMVKSTLNHGDEVTKWSYERQESKDMKKVIGLLAMRANISQEDGTAGRLFVASKKSKQTKAKRDPRQLEREQAAKVASYENKIDYMIRR